MSLIRILCILIFPFISNAQSIIGTWEYEVLKTASGDYFGELIIQKENNKYHGEIISRGESYNVSFNYIDADSISISSDVEGYHAIINGVFNEEELKAQVTVLGDSNKYNLIAQRKLNEQLLKVIDSKSKEIISYANVFYGNDGLITNEEGLCKIKRKRTEPEIIISAIGYLRDTVIITGKNEIEVIKLVPVRYTLPLIEIKAKGFNAEKIVKAAINNLERNYVQQSYNSNLFYRLSSFNSKDSLSYQSESILKFFDSQGYQKKRWRKVAGTRYAELQQGRITKGNQEDKLELGELNNIFLFWAHEPIVTYDKPLSMQSLKAYEFSLVGIKQFKSKKVYEIEFECKKLKYRFTGLPSLKYMNGKIFINEEDYAIIRYEHNQLMDYEFDGRHPKKRGNLTERTIIESSRIELFVKSDDGYYLDYAKVESNNERLNTLLNNEIKSYKNRTVEEFQYFDLTTKDVKPLNSNLFKISTKTQYDEAYWKQFNLVLKSD